MTALVAAHVSTLSEDGRAAWWWSVFEQAKSMERALETDGEMSPELRANTAKASAWLRGLVEEAADTTAPGKPAAA